MRTSLAADDTSCLRNLSAHYVDTVIIGAGFAGLGMGIQMARRKADSFVILERADEVGGTWRDNTYPGVACDIPSHLYSYSFLPNHAWSRLFATGPEIHQYLRDAVQSENLEPHLRLGTDVKEMRWDESQGSWLIQTNNETYRSRFLIIAAGRLSNPKKPRISGLDSFRGPVFHSAQWDHQMNFSGKRIGIAGTGASAVQIIPQLAGVAKELVIFQRSAPYIVPRNDRRYTEFERRTFQEDPASMHRLRSQIFWELEGGFTARTGEEPFVSDLRSRALGHLATQIPDLELRSSLTPNYEIGCKRVLLSDDYYPVFASGLATLEPSALGNIADGVATSERGREFDLDALVLATGFHTSSPPFASNVYGSHAENLSTRWSKGMTSYASTMVHGFPNLFILNGPNASLGHNSAIYMIETQIQFVDRAMRDLEPTKNYVLDVSQESEDTYTAALDSTSQSTVWTQGGCKSWYLDPRSQRLTLLWPGFAHTFREMMEGLDLAGCHRRLAKPPTVNTTDSFRQSTAVGERRFARPASTHLLQQIRQS